jgi:hypothetical protein
MSQRLGDLLVKEKIITPEQLEQANKVQKEQSCRLGSALVKLGLPDGRGRHEFSLPSVRRSCHQSFVF